MRNLGFATLIVVLIISCQQASNGGDLAFLQTGGTAKIIIDLQAVDFSRLAVADTIKVEFDHSRRRSSTYIGYPFSPILRNWVQEHDLDTASTQIVWVCKDDYRPINLLSSVLAQEGGYLVFRDLEVDAKEAWPDSLREKYSPYYLVWENIPYDNHQVAWPYGLVQVELLRRDPFENLYPPQQENLMQGFSKYRKHCVKCHPLNGIGGDLGPEFNSPRNITSYLSRRDIIAYAKDPKSYRSNSKMYAIRSLTDGDFDAIVDYLEWLDENRSK